MKVTKRTALGLLAAGFTTTLLSAPGWAQSKYAGQTLTVASFGGKVDETYRKAMAGFEEKFGVKIRWVPGTSTQNAAKAVASKSKPEFDVVMLDDVNLYGVSAMGDVLAPLNLEVMTNYNDLRPQAQFPHKDGVPLGFNYTGIYYNEEEFAKRGWAAPTSWQDLYRPEFCNHLGLMHPTISYTTNLLILLANGDAAAVPEKIEELGKLKGCVPTLEPSSAKMEEKIQLGEYLVGVHGVVRVLPLKVAGYPVRFVVPKEGSALSSTTAAVAKGGNEDLAQEFLNWLMSVEAQTILMEETYYIPANSKVRPSQALLDLGMPDPDTLDAALDPDRTAIMQNRREWSRRLERVLAN